MSRHFEPPACNSDSNFFPAAASWSTKTGIAPSRTQPRVIASPIPLPPPVMRTTLSLSCKSTRSRLQSVKSNGVAAKNVFSVLGGVGIDVHFYHAFYLTVGRGEKADRPVR